MLRDEHARTPGDDVAAEIEVAAEGTRLGDLRRPVDAPDRARVVSPLGVVQPLAERRLELMSPVGRLQRLPLEPVAVRGSADHDRVQAPAAGSRVRSKRLVVVPEAEVAGRRERVVMLASPGKERLDLRMGAQRRVDLHAAPAIVIAEAAARSYAGQAGLDRRDLPVIVARGQVVQFSPDIQLGGAKERTLEAERISGPLRRELVREMSRDKRMVVPLMIEDRDAHPERRREAVHRGEPVLALAEVRHDLEAARRLAQANDEDALAVAIDEIEGAAAAAEIAAACKSRRMDAAKGFDAVHLFHGSSGLEMWLGEAKFYGDIAQAMADAAKSLDDRFKADFLKQEFVAIRRKIDPAQPLPDGALQLFEPNVSRDRRYPTSASVSSDRTVPTGTPARDSALALCARAGRRARRFARRLRWPMR
jgi:hypothetical protein